MLQGTVEVNLELTGCGPEFVTDYMIPANPDSDLPGTIMTFRASLMETDEGFYADYSLGARVPMITAIQQTPGHSRNIEFRDMILKGAARLKLGGSIVVSKIAGRELQLSISAAN
jgi:hypothetical protein